MDTEILLEKINNGFCLINKATGEFNFQSKALDIKIGPKLNKNEFLSNTTYEIINYHKEPNIEYLIEFYDEFLEMNFRVSLLFSHLHICQVDIDLVFDDKFTYVIPDIYYILTGNRDEKKIKTDWGSYEIFEDYKTGIYSIFLVYKPRPYLIQLFKKMFC
jgi:hypothetical protein